MRCCCKMLYSVRRERMLMEQMKFNLLFRWFVGLSARETVWLATVIVEQARNRNCFP